MIFSGEMSLTFLSGKVNLQGRQVAAFGSLERKNEDGIINKPNGKATNKGQIQIPKTSEKKVIPQPTPNIIFRGLGFI